MLFALFPFPAHSDGPMNVQCNFKITEDFATSCVVMPFLNLF